MTEYGQCRVCGCVFAVDRDGHFHRKHGPKNARCKGRDMLAVDYPQVRSWVVPSVGLVHGKV